MMQATEAQALRAILDYLTLKGILFIRVQPVKPFTDRRTGHLRFAPVRQGQAGAPDIVIFLPGGRPVAVEVKASKGRLSPAQEEWRDALTKIGVVYVVARSVEDVERVVA